MSGEKDPARSAQPPHASPRPGGEQARPSTERSPDVIVDFDLDGDLLYIVVRNIGTGPASRIRVAFDPPFAGAGGVHVPRLALFHRLEFLPPGGELRAFVDRIAAYFAGEQPEVIVATATFHDDGGRGFRRRIRHDLGIYRDLPRTHRPGG
jgi:hypothetical protein